MTEELKLEDLKPMEVGKGIDFVEFEGNKVKIEAVTPIKVKTDYDEAGVLRAGLQREVWALRIQTEPVTSVTNKEGEEIELRASELCNLKYVDDTIGWSNHPEAKIQKIMKKCGKVDHPAALIGQMAVVVVRDKNDKQFFGIAY